jgi:uracil-DNA glycosylase family 4
MRGRGLKQTNKMTKLQLTPLRIDDCEGCPLFRTGQLCPDMPTSGEGELKVMIVGECYSNDTEVLTNFGWKRFPDLSGSELFYSVNPTNHHIELVKAVRGIKKHYNGDLFHYKTRSIDLLVTPEHLLYASSSNTRKFSLQPIQNIKSDMLEMLAVGELVGRTDVNPYLMKFLGFWLGDGWKEMCNGGYCIRFRMKKKRKVEYITSILDKLNIKYHKHKGKGKWHREYTSINFCHKKLYRWLPQGNVYSKRISQKIFAYSKQSLLHLLDGMIEADGCRKTNYIYSSNKGLIDDFQQLCILCGYPTTIGCRLRSDAVGREITKGHPIKSVKESYTLSRRKNNVPFTLLKSQHLKKVAYNGFVWDVKLEKNHILIVRRNGRVIFSSNSQGALEAQKGTQFIGPAGQLLRTVLTSLDLDLDRDFWKTNAIRCRPKGGKPPTTSEINACNSKLFKSIHKRKPKIVIALGKHALIALIGKYIDDITITKFRGLFIPIPEHNFYLVPALHPSFVARLDDDYSYATLQKDIKEGLSLLKYIPNGHTVEPLNIHKSIYLVTDFLTLSALMEKIHAEKPVSTFDFETSSKKPQDPRSRIWSMSICFNGKSYSFPIHYPAVQGVYPRDAVDTMWGSNDLPLVIDKIKRYLQDPACKKIVQNESFERIWSHFVLKSPVNGLNWCTMNAQHILDSRKGFCGLKLQAFIRWGVHHYDEEISYYMKSQEDRGANSLNQLHRAPLESLLLYGGIDSFLTEKLARAQLEVFNLKCNKPMHKARRLFHETAIAFTNCQKSGINIAVSYYQKVKTRLTNEITKNISAIQLSADVKKFERIEQRGFKLNSPVDLRVLLFDILGEKSKKKTTTGLDSVDKDVLTDLKTPVGKKIVKIRELKKLRDTYIAQYLRELVGKRVYPFLHTHTARSGRSSASNPSLQNTPERNEKAKKLIKRGIIPTPGNKIAEVDFSGIEIAMLACETKDKALLKYLWNPKSDMHYDQGKKLFVLDDSEMNKALRYNAKSDFVFLEVYGGKAAASAKYLWFDSIDLKIGKNSDGPTLRRHLAQQGIRNLDDFTGHVQEVESEFWKKYTGIKKWQKAQGKFYLEHGYVETQFGFRRSGYLKWEVILNTQTQSTAAHLLWWCFNKVDQIRIKERWKTKLLGQVHDSVLPDIRPEEEEHVMKTINRVMTRDMIEEFPWIIVPIDIEIEMAEVDQSWYDIKAVPKEYYETLASKEEVAATRVLLKSRVVNLGRWK